MKTAATWLMALACGGPLTGGALAQDEPKAGATAGVTVPDTPAGRQLAGWLGAINGLDREALRRFNVAHYAAATLEQLEKEGRTDLHWRAAEHTGGLELATVDGRSDTEVVAEAKMKRTGEWVRVELTVEAEAPHGITRIVIGPGTGPLPEVPAGKLTPEQIAGALGAHLDRLAAADEFSGVVVVAKDGEPVFARAYGESNKERKVPNRLDTAFSLASMGKMFTAVAVAQLVEQGKLSYDDPIGKHLPDYPNAEAARKVTIHHLLTHTSGIGDFFNERWEARRRSVKTVQDYLDLFADEPLRFEPGSKWEYSNGGFVVLGAILERVTGRDYYEYVADHVFKPAGMTHSGFFTPDEADPALATGYTHEGADGAPRSDAWRSNAAHAPGRGNPAGGAWASAGDVLRFAEALRTGKLLDARAAAALTEAKDGTGQGPEERYGYGFMVLTVNGHRAFGHFGGFPGVSTGLEVYPDLGYSVVILSNYDFGGPKVLMPLQDWIARD